MVGQSISIRKSLLAGLAILGILGALQGVAGLLGNRTLQWLVDTQTKLLTTVTETASAQLSFERADRAAQASRGASNPAWRLEFSKSFRAEAERLRAALSSAALSEPAIAKLLEPTIEWIEQTDLRLPGSQAGPQATLLRDDLLSEMSTDRQREIAAAITTLLQQAEAARAEAAHVFFAGEAAIFGIVSLSLLSSIRLGFLLRRRVLNPLSQLTGTTRRLAEGDLSCSVEGVTRDDEIGAVASALDTLRRGTLRTLAVEAAAAKERSASDARIRFLAHHDPLTGLPNRAMLHERLEQAVALARRSDQKLALFWIDLDRFKAVNDSRGHAAGDSLLREVARRLLATVRETDIVARLGGDEFVVVQVGADQPRSADQLAERLRVGLAELYQIGEGERAVVTASIGVAVYPDDGDEAEALLSSADLAMYRAKANGCNRYAFFQPEMDQEAQARRSLEQDLCLALSAQQFAIFYQPQLDVLTGEIVGFEALLRWNHPDRGQVSPDQFISIAESNGMIVPIGAWVLEQVCHEASRWIAPLRVAVNVSPIQFQQADMKALVAAALESSGLDPLRLELEITEGVLIRDAARTLESLRRIRRSGVTIALDDFGTGYSSLSTLRAFPFDRIKVDRSFVKDLASSKESSAIVHAVIGLAHGLGLPVIAEGVEDNDQLEILKKAGCSEIQGFLIGKPQPIYAFSDLTGRAAALAAS